MIATEIHNHIRCDKNGVAWIDNTNTKVIEVVLDKLAQGWSAEEIHFQHSYLSLAQIHAALAYYYDHQAELDEKIERDYQEVKKLEKFFAKSQVVNKLRRANS
ncbi:MAG: DUF433 domain-containing protein [Verrucomicrobiota bacterium]|nr:DUF433 domain-containing protein [Verrucomicrobiota bacterium]